MKEFPVDPLLPGSKWQCLKAILEDETSGHQYMAELPTSKLIETVKEALELVQMPERDHYGSCGTKTGCGAACQDYWNVSEMVSKAFRSLIILEQTIEKLSGV